LIVFDGYYLKNKEKITEIEQQCCTLVEKGMSVDKFHKKQNFENLAQKSSLKLIEVIDLSENILPSLLRFEKLAKIYFEHHIVSKFVNFLLPEMFIRNSLAGYLMPELIKAGIAGYYCHIFKKIKTP